MSEPQNGRGALFTGGLAAILASACCLGPLVLVALGFSGAWIGNLTVLEPYRPIFIGAALVAMFFAWHRDYHLAVFNWFRTGQLSNGQPLPDTLLAFCPWLLSSKLDDSAWFDSFYGDHTPTIDAVKALPVFQRRFSWEE